MSGHSKWHNIQAKKGKADAARGRIFTKLGREIAVAAKNNPNPDTNSKLADIIAKAKAANMPNDNIMRSIKKAAGEMNGSDYKELVYEGYGPAGSAVIVTTLTDNNNRTASDIRAVMGKHGGSMGSTGCVSYNFDNKGYIVVERTVELDEDTMTEYALDAGRRRDERGRLRDLYCARKLFGSEKVSRREKRRTYGGCSQGTQRRGRGAEDQICAGGGRYDSAE